MIACIQSEFDPKLDVKEVTHKGIRGEIYEAFLQAYEARLWVDASPEEIELWLSDTKNLRRFMQEFNLEEQYFTKYQQTLTDSVLYAPGVFESGILKLKIDTFTVQTRGNRAFNTRVYLVGLGKLVLVELHIKPEARGSLATIRFTGEIPAGASPDFMNMMLFAANIPEILQEKLLLIKKELEGEG